jgi:hypothetical protein
MSLDVQRLLVQLAYQKSFFCQFPMLFQNSVLQTSCPCGLYNRATKVVMLLELPGEWKL